MPLAGAPDLLCCEDPIRAQTWPGCNQHVWRTSPVSTDTGWTRSPPPLSSTVRSMLGRDAGPLAQEEEQPRRDSHDRQDRESDDDLSRMLREPPPKPENIVQHRVISGEGAQHRGPAGLRSAF